MPAEKRDSAMFLIEHHSLSVRQACKVMKLSSSTFYYEPKIKSDDEIIDELKKLSEENYRWGFWMMFYSLRNEGKTWNHKRVYRVYTEMRLALRSKRKKRLPKRVSEPLLQPLMPNLHWSMDFMMDNLRDGKKFRTLNVIDDFNREALAIVPSKSITANRVILELEQLIEWRGKPETIRVDNGPEFIAETLQKWTKENHIELKFIQPGKPAQNGYIERFNRTYRNEVLSMHLFGSLNEVFQKTNNWIVKYNNKRPHRSLNRMTPRAFLLKYGKLNKQELKEFPTFQQDNNSNKQKNYIFECN
jgi:putative transposase